MEHQETELTSTDHLLCRTCRNLNLRIETFVQTGWRYPTTLAYETIDDFFDRIDESPAKETHYVEGERLEADKDYEDRELTCGLKSAPFEWDEDCGRPFPPKKHQDLGTLDEISRRAAEECRLCQLVACVALEPYWSKSRTFSESGTVLKGNELCRIAFNFKNVEHQVIAGDKESLENKGSVRPQEYGYYECSISIGQKLDVAIYPLPRQDDMRWFGGRLLKPEIDYSLVKRWIDSCERLHTACSREKQRIDTSSMSSLRVIDLHSSCLTTITTHQTQFAALSYVWGSVPMFMATKDTLHSLCASGGLDLYMNEIPRTIRDAMHVVRRLGIQYLWTDSICMVQDDKTELDYLIRRMDTIYASAYLTIVAAEGSHANAGLRGTCSENPRAIPRTFRYSKDLDLFAPSNTLSDILLSCPWSARGWTLQEALLSSRLLIFTNGGMHFTCGSLSWSEEMNSVSEATGPPWRHANEPAFYFRAHLTSEVATRNPLAGNMWDLELWIQMVADLSERKLKTETDILFAGAGLIVQLERFYRTRSLYGLPERHLEEFLSWSPAMPGSLRRRQDASKAPFNPSWSWSGWVGEVDWHGGAAESVKLEETQVHIRKLHRLADRPLMLETNLPSLNDTTTEDFPFLLITAPTCVFQVLKATDTPDWVQELQPLAWYEVLPDALTRDGVYCVYSHSDPPEPMGSVVFDSKVDCNFDHGIGCEFISISSWPQRLDVGEYAGQLFFNVLAVRRMRTRGHNVAERIGSGRLALEKLAGNWKREAIVLA
jgi:hypothetical protein